MRWFLIPLFLALPGCSEDNSTDPSPDRMPPSAVEDLEVAATSPGAATLRWTAPGDDGASGTAARYDLRYARSPLTAENWNSAASAPSLGAPKPAGEAEERTIPFLEAGSWYFAVRAADEVPNWSEPSNLVVADVPPVVSGFVITDLAVVSEGPESIELRWTAPGDSARFAARMRRTGPMGSANPNETAGSIVATDLVIAAATNTAIGAVEYDLRTALEPITWETFDAADPAVGLAAPGPPGAEERFTVWGLQPQTTYHFALKASDAEGLWSALSNSATGTTTRYSDLVVGDLEATAEGPGTATLRWTAPGPPGEVQGAAYDIRYAFSDLTPQTWESAARVGGLPSPGPGGSSEILEVVGLHPVAMYNFALRVADRTDAWSTLSNVARVTIPLGPVFWERLTATPDSVVWAGDWSPDGRTLVFHTNWTGENRLYRMSVPGGTPQILSAERAEYPRWSPDGEKVAYVTLPPPGSNGLSELKIMGKSPGDPSFLVTRHGPKMDINRPSWSPDGRSLVYSIKKLVGTPPFDDLDWIYIVEAVPGATPTLIGPGLSPDWSPDGTKIVYALKGRDGGVSIMEPDGSASVVLWSNQGTSNAIWPLWSPEGSRIAFVFRTNIWLMSRTGENAVEVTATPELEALWSWSPDGRSLCVARPEYAARTGDLWRLGLEDRLRLVGP